MPSFDVESKFYCVSNKDVTELLWAFKVIGADKSKLGHIRMTEESNPKKRFFLPVILVILEFNLQELCV